MAALSDLEWASPLQALEIVPGHEYEESAHIPDYEISLVIPRLPTSLRHLSLKGLKLTFLLIAP